jgi:hypothetical protein
MAAWRFSRKCFTTETQRKTKSKYKTGKQENRKTGINPNN